MRTSAKGQQRANSIHQRRIATIDRIKKLLVFLTCKTIAKPRKLDLRRTERITIQKPSKTYDPLRGYVHAHSFISGLLKSA